ncbi:MAG: tetratricopeptide repeat protein [Sedimentisphaerales bacterium]
MIKPKPPIIIQEIQWVLMYGKKYWRLLFVTLAVLGIFVFYKLVPIFFSGKNQGQHSESKTNGNLSPANTTIGPNSSVNNTYNIYGEENNHKEIKAIDAYKRDIKINPDKAISWVDLSHLYVRLKNYEDAIGACREAIRIDPNSNDAYDHLGFAYSMLGRWQEAADAFQNAIKVNQKDAEAYGNLGVVYGQLGRYGEAIEAFKQTIILKPDSAEAYNDWSHVLRHLAKNEKGKVREQLLVEGKEKCLKAESIKRGSGAYFLACISAWDGDKTQCQKWLIICEQADMLPPRKRVMSEPAFDSVRNEEWFKQIGWSDDPIRYFTP